MHYLIYDLDYSELLKIFKAAWSKFLAISVSNNFPYNLIILKSYRLLPINTCRISLFSKIIIWIHSLLEHEKIKSKSIMRVFSEGNSLVAPLDWFSLINSHISCIDCKHNKLHSDTQVLQFLLLKSFLSQ